MQIRRSPTVQLMIQLVYPYSNVDTPDMPPKGAYADELDEATNAAQAVQNAVLSELGISKDDAEMEFVDDTEAFHFRFFVWVGYEQLEAAQAFMLKLPSW